MRFDGHPATAYVQNADSPLGYVVRYGAVKRLLRHDDRLPCGLYLRVVPNPLVRKLGVSSLLEKPLGPLALWHARPIDIHDRILQHPASVLDGAHETMERPRRAEREKVRAWFRHPQHLLEDGRHGLLECDVLTPPRGMPVGVAVARRTLVLLGIPPTVVLALGHALVAR